MLKGAVIIVLALALFAPLGLWIHRHWSAAASDPTISHALFAVPEECRPEPAERLIYLSGLVLVPGCIFALARLASGCADLSSSQASGSRAILSCLLAIGLVFFAVYAFGGDKDDAGQGWYHVRFNFFREHPVVLVIVPVWLALVALYRPGVEKRNRWYWPLVGCVALVPWAGSVFPDTWLYAGKWHFNAVFDSLVRMHVGKTLLVDSTAQYGLYAWFLNPIFRVFGLSVAKFTTLMGLLTACSYGMIGLFLKRQLSRPLIAALGLIATLFNGWMLFLTVEGPHRGSYFDLYFQYVPLRLFIPALMLGLAGSWLASPSNARGRLLWAVLACGLLWNLDSGAPAFAAWALTLIFLETEPARPPGRLRRLLTEFAIAGAAVSALFCTYALHARWAAGAWPDFTLLFRSQLIFYAHGFAMLPMPWPGAWMAIIALYLIGLACAALDHAKGACTGRSRAMFLVSVLGLLLFSYYQGRSHRAVLILAWWPAFPLLALLLDALLDLMEQERQSRSALGAIACLPAAILLGSTFSFFTHLGMVGDYTGRQLGSLLYPGTSGLSVDAAILSRLPTRGAPVWIISSRESILHLKTGRRQMAPCSFNELLLMQDYPKLASMLKENPSACIWIDKRELELAIAHHQGVHYVADMLAQSYEPIAVGEQGWLFRRRSRSEPVESRSLTAHSPGAP